MSAVEVAVIYTIGERRMESAGDAWYVAPGAQVIGSIRLGCDASVWFGAVLRGDNDWIEIGDETNVQDGTIIHTDEGAPTHIGRGVTIGHRALLHSCTVGDESMIANGAMVLDGARIGRHCIIAAGALVPPGREIPDGSMVMGSPGRITRQLGERDLAMITHAAAHYCARARLYREALRVDPRSGAGQP
ncbi:MAG TPA: gamma carbonic anhydrase family protein [Steroidobacteraceae bacterium]|nr:gamma carbonic anhydrase family protein [Steroidobacteraceae bacterium]